MIVSEIAMISQARSKITISLAPKYRSSSLRLTESELEILLRLHDYFVARKNEKRKMKGGNQ